MALWCAATWTIPAPSRGLEIPLDSRGTYLHVCTDPALAAVPVLLADLGIQPGDVVLLENVGGFDNGPGTDTPRTTIAVFSGSATLLTGSAHPRVPDAIDAGVDFITANTYFCGGQSTDIPEDLRADSTVVVVPAGATHLFASGHDQLYYDNTDPNGDYALGITKIGATGVTATAGPAATGFAVLPGWPNPFRSRATIGYTVPGAAVVSLRIFDAAGRHVRTLEHSISRTEGKFAATWDGCSQFGDAAPAGVYFCVLESGATRVAGRVVLVR
ncbi:MAG: FlgD immunoglobulin-like domain containing protein [Candidatus Eiseniibacteriota bacterium]